MQHEIHLWDIQHSQYPPDSFLSARLVVHTDVHSCRLKMVTANVQKSGCTFWSQSVQMQREGHDPPTASTGKADAH